MAVWSANAAFKHEKKYQRSIEIRRLVLERCLPNLSSNEVFYFALENGRDARAAGEAKLAVAWYDRVLTMFPDYGLTDGQIVNLKYERIDAHCLPENSPQRTEMLKELWDAYGTNEWRTAYKLGAHLSDRYYYQTNANGKRLLIVLLERLGSHLAKAQPGTDQPLRDLEEDYLPTLAYWHVRDGELAKAAEIHKLYLAKYPTGNHASMARMELANLNQATSPSIATAGRRIWVVTICLLSSAVMIFVMWRTSRGRRMVAH
jgi:tetratricopeptide (TPR) repeat protein